MAKITVKFVRYSCYIRKLYNRRKTGAVMVGKNHNNRVSEKMMRCVM